MGKKSKKGMSRAGGIRNKKAKRAGQITRPCQKATVQEARPASKTCAQPVSPTSLAEFDLQLQSTTKSVRPSPLKIPSSSDDPLVVNTDPKLEISASSNATEISLFSPSLETSNETSLTEPSKSEATESQKGCYCSGCIIL